MNRLNAPPQMGQWTLSPRSQILRASVLAQMKARFLVARMKANTDAMMLPFVNRSTGLQRAGRP